MKQQIFLFFTFFHFFITSAHAELKTEGEAGIVSTTGNSRNQSYTVKDKTFFQNGKDTYSIFGSYLEARRDSLLTAQSWLLGARYERAVASHLSFFLAQQGEGDKFAGILQRYNSDLGGRHAFIKRDKDLILATEGGYRFTHEHSTKNDYHSFQKARIFLEVEKFLRADVSGRVWVEYLPNFTDGTNWLLNSEASLSAALNSVFALKVGYYVRFNNTPPVPTAVKTDTTFTTALTAKL